MATRGVRQPGRNRKSTYDPTLGLPYRLTVVLSPDEAVKAIEAADQADISLSGLIAQLVRRMPVDDNGRPTWAEPKQEVTDPLPLASGG